MKLPVLICEKLFYVMDKQRDDFLSCNEITSLLSKLYFGSFEETAEIIFQIYDFNNSGEICSEEVKLILSFLPLEEDKHDFDYTALLENLTEIEEIIEKVFLKTKTINFKQFLKEIKNTSDIYLQLLCFMYLKCPFKYNNVNLLISSPSKTYKNSSIKEDIIPFNLDTKLTTSPNNKNSKKSDNDNFLFENNTIKTTGISMSSSLKKKASFVDNYFSELNQNEETRDIKLMSLKSITKEEEDEDEYANSLNNSIQKEKHKEEVNKHPMQKKSHVSQDTIDRDKINSPQKTTKINPETEIIQENKFEKIDNFKFNMPGENDHFGQSPPRKKKSSSNFIEVKFNGYYEDFIYKYSKKTDVFEKYWMLISGKDLFHYSDTKKQNLVKINNICGCFIKDNGSLIIKEEKYYTFSIIYEGKQVAYYTKSKEEMKNWTQILRAAIGRKNFFDYYAIVGTIDKGPTYILKYGNHKTTKEKVTIKIIEKIKLKTEELRNLKYEVEIHKTCNHPCILKFIEYFENSEFIFIVTERDEKNLKQFITLHNILPENVTRVIFFRVLEAINYLHKFEIIYRNIKLENITINDIEEHFEVKLNNFDGSVISGSESHSSNLSRGSIYFSAPEILSKQKYDKSADIWSLGVLLYKLLSGIYPFDNKVQEFLPINQNTLIEKIVAGKFVFPDKYWNKVENPEYKNLIASCLDKDPQKRPKISDILKHKVFECDVDA